MRNISSYFPENDMTPLFFPQTLTDNLPRADTVLNSFSQWESQIAGLSF